MITIQQISNYSTLDSAYKIISGKSKVSGLDGISPADFGTDLERNLKELSWALKAGVYEPSDLKQWELEKNGKTRKMGILTCSDRIVATALSKALVKNINGSFIDNCFAYRPGKSALEAVSVAASSVQAGLSYFLRLDIEDYFGSIDHALLGEIIAPFFDTEVFKITMKLIKKSGFNRECGIALGSPLSPVLSNIFLMALDRKITEETDGIYLRYADDLLYLTNSDVGPAKTKKFIEDDLDKYKLKVNHQKTVEGNVVDGFDFLGFRIDAEGIKASDHAEDALNEMLQMEWENSKWISLRERMESLQRRFNGWKGYYQNEITGGYLGVAVLIFEGKTDPEKIIDYRRRLPYDDFSMISLLASLWESRHHMTAALEEYEGFLGIPQSHESFDEEMLRTLIDKFKSLYSQWSNDKIVDLALFYSEKGLYVQADYLTKYMNDSKRSEGKEKCEIQFGYSNASLDIFKELFFSNRHHYLTECLVQKERRFIQHESIISNNDLKRHLAGEITLNTRSTDDQYQSDFLVFDIDVEKKFLLMHPDSPEEIGTKIEEAERYAFNLVKLLHNYGCTAFVEDSGGMGRHVWIFFDQPVPYIKAAEMGAALIEQGTALPDDVTVEILPPNRTIKIGQQSPSIKVPFGKNVRTGKRSMMKTIDGKLILNWSDASECLVKTDVKSLIKSIGKIKRLEKSLEPINDDYERLGNLTANVEQIIKNCDIMRRLCLKAYDTHFLNHFERLSLLYIFGHMGKEGKNFLHAIMRKTLDYNEKTTNYFISKCPKSPVGCSKLRNELIGLGCKHCKCDFHVPKGCYASPIIHAIDRKTFRVEDKEITLPVIESGDKDEVTEYFDNQNQIDKRVSMIIHLGEEIKKLSSQRSTLKYELIDLICETGSEKIETPFGILKINGNNELTIVLE